MSEKLDIPNVMTPKFRVSFPAVFRPGKAVDPTKPPKYGITMLFDKGADLSPLMNAMVDFMTKKFGPNKDTWPKLSRNPFRDQGEKTFEGYVAGAKFINASSNTKPGLVDASNNDIINEADFYPGCYARATVRPFWYDTRGNKGVAFGLQNIQKLGDGEPLGGRVAASKEFEPVAPANGGGSADTAKTAADLFG